MSDDKNIKGGSTDNGKTDGNYFGKREENAVSEYLNCTDNVEKQRIYKEILKPAFTKMIESLIRRYNLFTVDEAFEDTFNDTLSFLMMKLDKYDASKGFKAYSYCGTVCKNHLIKKRRDSQKNEALCVTFNPTLGNGLPDNNETREEVDEKNRFTHKVIEKMVEAIKRSVDNKEEQNLTENEYKVGQALIQLLTGWETVFDNPDIALSNKYSKMSVMYYLTENTLLSTEEVRAAMKRYKLLYMIVKGDFLHDIYNEKEEI